MFVCVCDVGGGGGGGEVCWKKKGEECVGSRRGQRYLRSCVK